MDSSKAKRREGWFPEGQNLAHGTESKNKKRIFAEMPSIR
jgi:hypothetical protein